MAETLREVSLVCQHDIVFCDPGDDVVLSCQLQPAFSALLMEIKWQYRADIICHYDGQMTVSEGYMDKVSLSLLDLLNGNVSLTLKDVRAPQRGIYICEVIHEQQTFKEYIFLHVSSEIFRLVAPIPMMSADPGEDVLLLVHLSPQTSAVYMKIKWFRRTDLIYQYMCGQEITYSDCENRVDLSTQELEWGNLSLTLRNVQQSDSGRYTCKVFHDGSVTTAEINLQVRDNKKTDCSKMKSRSLDFLRQVEKNLQQQNQMNEMLEIIKKIKDCDDNIAKRTRKTRDDVSSRRTNSMEGMPPRMEDENLLEDYEMEYENEDIFNFYEPTTRRTGSMEGMPPRMEEESSPNTTQTRAGNLPMGQEMPSPATTSEILPEQRTSELVNSSSAATQPQENPRARMQLSQDRRQEVNSTEQEMSLSAAQSQVLRESSQSVSPSPAAERQTEESSRTRAQLTQRRQERKKNCQIM